MNAQPARIAILACLCTVVGGVGLAGAATVQGTGAGELAVGTTGRDTILAAGGDDVVFGLAGRDTIDGGSGDDRIDGDGVCPAHPASAADCANAGGRPAA